MQITRLKKIIGFVLSVLFVLVMKDIPLIELQAIPKQINLNETDIVAVNNDALFGKFIELKTKNQNKENTTLQFELFGLFPIRSVRANIVDKDLVYVGGNPVGFSLNSEGLIVVGANSVLTKSGRVDTLKNSNVEVGDIIIEIEGQKITKTEDAEAVINIKENEGKNLQIKAVRKNKEIMLNLTPALDAQTNRYKMGLWVRDDAAGVGTLTFVKKDNLRFGALGHPICDIDTKVPFSVHDGKMYSSNIIGIKKGTSGIPGELKGLFLRGQKAEGNVEKNDEFGVFGYVNKESKILNEELLYKIGGRLTARPGKAKIRAGLEGHAVEEYDIEIIKTNYQNVSKQKSMVIRVTDKRLLSKTGGIVQGMSGSPILQNGKVVGAVTHVFVNDPKKGFGVYLDWMIGE
ncbi:MAG: SpoIVB peptidase [Tenericutes bacterium HGW-Tenericutes-4]|nr:MAG: SpoIVB peptidase [Tenericutes bacterium HGW-Tenericutes-4]